MQDFRELKVWQKAHELALGVYRATVEFPREEIYGLTSQVRRASVSIACNIAEGRGRSTDSDFARFVGMAMGSANEVDYQLLLARDLGYLAPKKHETLNANLVEVKKMLNTLFLKLKASG